MPGLTAEDISLGRLALSKGAVTRPQLDSAIALCRNGQAQDLARAFLRTGSLTVPQIQQLRSMAAGVNGSGRAAPPPPPPPTPNPPPPSPPPPSPAAPGGWSEAQTLHDRGGRLRAALEAQRGGGSGSGFGGPPAGSAFGAPPAAFGGSPGFGGPTPGSGSGYGSPPGSAFGAPSPGFGGSPGGSAFGAPPAGFGGPPGGSAFGSPPGNGYSPTGSGFGGGQAAGGFPNPPLGLGPGPGGSAFGPGPGGSAFGPGPGGSAFGPGPGGSAFAGSPGGSAFGAGPGGSAFGAGPGAAFGAGPGGSAFGPGPGGTAFGAGPGGTAFGSGPGGSAFGAAPAAAPAFGASPVGMGGFGASPAPQQESSVLEGEDERIGDWVVERELARGGMGVVYLAHRDGTQEKAAIKVMLQTNGSVNERKVKRFLREIKSNSKLAHPNIVKILDSGEFRGYPFFAMEYVPGKPLDRMLKDDLDLEIGMEILEKMARAVHYAHENGVVHRDLKPANVIVRDDMEPKLTDFGLAKDQDHQSVLTKTGAVLGTPYYLSPEQASGKSKDIDRRADIYSLGVIMYELATGRLPFVGQTTVELYNRIIHDEPVPPSKIKPQLTKALETVCLKAMAKEPDERYPTADAFADDIKALLGGGTIEAKAQGPLGKWFKRVRKRGSIPVVLGGTTVLLALVLGGLTWHYKQKNEEQHQKRVALELEGLRVATAETLGKTVERLLRGREALRQGPLPDALDGAKQCLELLDELEAKYGELTFPEENGPPVGALQEESQARRRQVRAAALVLRARATMLRDERGALDRAQKDLTAILDEKEGVLPEDIDALAAQGDLLALKGNLNDALGQYGKVLEREAGSVKALYGKARVLLVKEDFEEAISDLSHALDVLSDDTPAGGSATGQGSGEGSAAGEGSPAAPAAGDDPLVAIDPGERRQLEGLLRVERARARLEMNQPDKALADARAAEQALESGWVAKACEGDILVRMGHAYEARDAYAAAISRAPEHAGPRIARAQGMLRLDHAEEAWEDANAAVSFDPGSLLALVVRAEAAEQRLDFESAEQDATSAQLRAQTRHWRVAARAERVLARLEGSVGNVAEAHDHAKKARSLDEFSSAGRLLLARVEIDPFFEGQYLDSAERLFKQVARQRPDSLEAKRGQGLVLLQKFATQPERALRKFEDALHLDPRDPWTLSALARVFEAKAKKDPAEAERNRNAAASRWEKAGRYERDVRRPEGMAYVLGLIAEKRARQQTGKQRAASTAVAQRAYQRATWLDPLHVHAHTGLASLAYLQGAHAKTGQHLKRAVFANPRAIHTAVMYAYHQATSDGVRENANSAKDALDEALRLRGETIGLLTRQVFLQTLSKRKQDLGEKLTELTEAFTRLRERDPLNVEVLEAERELLSRIADQNLKAPETPDYRERIRVLNDEIEALETQLDERLQAAQALRTEAADQLKAGEATAAVELARQAAEKTPTVGAAWQELADAHDAAGQLWLALAAGIRAAQLDDAYVAGVFRLLRRAGSEKAPPEEELLAAHREVLPYTVDLNALLGAAPLVARAVVTTVPRDEAKRVFDELELVLNHDPTRLISHAMLGALAFGVQRDEYAIQHLLFIASVREDLGEARYLAAVAAARGRSPSRALDVLAVENLRRAKREGFAWKGLVEQERSLERLRASELWKRID